MAQKLTDVVLRRTELGSAGHPGATAALACAESMASELGWNENRMKKEIEELRGIYQPVG
jgi:glycerol-3-phosphate dehydrogenase